VSKFAVLRTGSRRLAGAGGALAVASLMLSACGGGGSPSAAKASSTTTTAAAAVATASQANSPAGGESAGGAGSGAGGAGGGARPADAASFAPAASGTIASITGNTLEVQSQESGQTTVILTAKTRITATVAVKLTAVKAGTCVTASGTKGSGGAAVDATSIAIVASVKGKCVVGLGGGRAFGGGGGGGGGTFVTRTTTAGSRTITRPANFAVATGQVLSVSGSTITIKGIAFSIGAPRPRTPSPSKSTTSITRPPTKTLAVKISAKTRYSQTEAAKAGALKVGECATAFGSANSIGAVTATRLTVTQPTSSGCSAFGGFGGFGGGSGRGGFAGGGFGRGGGAGGTGASSGAAGAAGTTP
jgi:Domain of unknown function (DUF5666)